LWHSSWFFRPCSIVVDGHTTPHHTTPHHTTPHHTTPHHTTPHHTTPHHTTPHHDGIFVLNAIYAMHETTHNTNREIMKVKAPVAESSSKSAVPGVTTLVQFAKKLQVWFGLTDIAVLTSLLRVGILTLLTLLTYFYSSSLIHMYI
jgi:hypothetical protein